MKLNIVGLIALGLSVTSVAYADGVADGGLLRQNSTSWRRAEKEKAPEVTQKMKDAFSASALRNVLEAETAFCYTVSSATSGYTGYTLNNFAITGFCGILPEIERNLFIDNYLKNEAGVSDLVAQCVIQPRLMLRFVRGVDYTDILYSSPCSSFTLFYGGKVKSFNTEPSSELMDAMIGAYEKKRQDFVSPALIGQVLPIGVPQTEEQQKKIREQQIQKPVRGWVTPDQNETPSAPANTPKKGWNRIKLGQSK